MSNRQAAINVLRVVPVTKFIGVESPLVGVFEWRLAKQWDPFVTVAMAKFSSGVDREESGSEVHGSGCVKSRSGNQDAVSRAEVRIEFVVGLPYVEIVIPK
jgi:hypothetical protein